MEYTIPRLRTDIDIFPTSYKGEKVFVVKDLLGLIPQPVLLREEALRIIGLIDGKRSLRDIQVALMRMSGGVLVALEDVEEVISQLDKAFLLDSSDYRREKTRFIDEYARLPIREAVLAGNAYPEDPDRLSAYIQSILEMGEKRPDIVAGKRRVALVAPHIDLEIGKSVYASAYRTLEDFSPERVLLLGTGHNLSDSFFSLTMKDYQTPLGRICTDRASVERLREAAPPHFISSFDIDHKNEHSLEFQILFLQVLFGNDFGLLPVLCGSFHRVLGLHSGASEIPGMTDFISGLRHFLEEGEGPALIAAGVDFSHIGPKFGHSEPATSLLLEAKQHDRSLLDALSRGEAKRFWSEIKKRNNRFNVCGFSTLALLLELLSGKTGQILGYDFWMEEATRSGVSFAALAYPFG